MLLLLRELSLWRSSIDALFGNHCVGEWHACEGVLVTTCNALVQKIGRQGLAHWVLLSVVISTHSVLVQIVTRGEVEVRIDFAKAVVGDGLVQVSGLRSTAVWACGSLNIIRLESL